MSYSNWDRGTVNEDGTISGSWYIVNIDYAACYAIYNQEPVGKKQLPAQAVATKKGYVITVENQPVAQMPTGWTQLVHAVRTRGPLNGEAIVEWRAYVEPQRFMVKFYLKNA